MICSKDGRSKDLKTHKIEGETNASPSWKHLILPRFFRLAEVTLQQTLESLAVAGFIARHFVDAKSLRDFGCATVWNYYSR